MGYTSVSGIGFAALTLVLAALPMTAPKATTASSLDVSISGKRSAKGLLLVCLTSNPKAFPDCSKDPKARTAKVSASGAAVSFDGLAPGSYAISMIHDENGNGKMDMRVFLPREGFGFSRNPTITFGPPKFGAASFQVGEGANSQAVKLRYML